MKPRKCSSTFLLSTTATFGLIFLFSIVWLAPSVKAARLPEAIPGAQTTPVTATATSPWNDLLEKTPLAVTAPLPEPVQSPLDGTYTRLDPSWPQWWTCRRCADYRSPGGIWKLQFAQGVMRIYYEITGWRSIASFTVSGDRLRIFNDAYCSEMGEYTWKLEDGNLQLEIVNDPCAFNLRAKNLSKQPWSACLSPDKTTEANGQSQQPPGCEENPAISSAASPSNLPVTVTVHKGDSRFFKKPPDIFASANSTDRISPEGVHVTYHRDSIPFGLSRVLWWNGDWIEASTDLPFAAMGVQFFGEPQIGWARVLFDGEEVWRGNTAEIWSKYNYHGGYIEISGFNPGLHTIRAESLGFDYHPVTVASFGFSHQTGVESQAQDESGGGATQVSEKDGVTMVFVPAGEFTMGSDNTDPEAEADEKPQNLPTLDAYWIDQTEVTNAKYTGCVEAGGCTAPIHSSHYPLPEYADHPVAGVTWFQAEAYCHWAGRRLPTEAEWEKAARSTDGRLYPWGNAAPDTTLLNFAGQVGDTTAAGSYPAGASPYGALDMAGNVWEWVSDGYDASYYTHAPTTNPPGGISANQRVIRGGAWGVDARAVRSANRFWAFPGRNDTDGFRCALSASS